MLSSRTSISLLARSLSSTTRSITSLSRISPLQSSESSLLLSRSTTLRPSIRNSNQFRFYKTTQGHDITPQPEDKYNLDTVGKDHENNNETEIVERGHIYFFYKPKVNVTGEPKSLSDVQRLFIVLAPEGVVDKTIEQAGNFRSTKKRIIVVPKKTLPDPAKHTKYFGIVTRVSDDAGIDAQLSAQTTETKTRGTTHLEGARPVGEGSYAICTHSRDKSATSAHTHLLYVLHLPQEPGQIQSDFNIKHEGSFIIAVKNPKAPSRGDIKLSHEPLFTEPLLRNFDNRSYAPVTPGDYLDYENAQVVLIGAADDIVAELGHTGEEVEGYEDAQSTGKHTFSSLLKDLHESKSRTPGSASFTKGL